LIDELYNRASCLAVQPFSNSGDITQYLQKQWAGHLYNYWNEIKRKNSVGGNSIKVINPYKFFYYRTKHHNISFDSLSRQSELTIDELKLIEEPCGICLDLDESKFVHISLEKTQLLAKTLGCLPGDIVHGMSGDYSAKYVFHYHTQKKTPNFSVRCKALVLDFDGTLTTESDRRSTWELLWKHCGYKIDDCFNLHRRFINGEFSHQEWCDITANKFRVRKLHKSDVLSIADNIQLVPSAADVVKSLTAKDIPVYIVSGSIRCVIDRVLSKYPDSFNNVTIKANRMEFTRYGSIKKIIGTQYDFKGKAEFIKDVIHEHKIKPYEVVFVGNSNNDEYAFESGAQTLCVNPHMANALDDSKWTYCLPDMHDFSQIYQYIKF
jgi:HAD superfamily phosphoserine phosphatase-like hydrolase